MLEKINKVNDIKKLNLKEKKVLANEIREYLIDTVSKNGGHLASNLGVVELTIALESVFDLKKDKIVWDVGHQCYVHKILTGRKEEFKTLRKFNGLSGFPKREESITDCFNTGHSSTSISAAMGIAKARDIQKKDFNVVAVIGDGALTGGMAMEALNHAGWNKTKMIIILNDNEMSISENNSGMNKLLTKLRSKSKYRKSNIKIKKFISKIPLVGNGMVNFVAKTKDAIKQVVIPGMYFEEIGIRYLGPIDGHNIEVLEEILKEVKTVDEPVLLHVVTKKGMGYKYALDNPTKFHCVGPFDVKTGNLLSLQSTNYSKVFGNKLIELAKSNKKIVAITASMKDGVGLSDFANIYPNRYFDVGIAEQHALTFAAGLSSSGMIPFVSIYSSFYQRAYDQIIHDICLQSLHVVMCVDRAGIVGEDGKTHQGIYDMSFLKLIPNIVIMAPKNFKELELMLEYAVKLEKPIIIRYPKGSEDNCFDKCTSIKLGKSEIIKEGKDLTIIGIGKTVSKCYKISESLKEVGISAEVINARFLKPLDEDAIIKSINKTKKVVVTEDSTIIGGLSSSIKELILEKKLKDIKLKTFAYPDEFIEHGSIDEIEKKYNLDVQSIIKSIKEEMFDNFKER